MWAESGTFSMIIERIGCTQSAGLKTNSFSQRIPRHLRHRDTLVQVVFTAREIKRRGWPSGAIVVYNIFCCCNPNSDIAYRVKRLRVLRLVGIEGFDPSTTGP